VAYYSGGENYRKTAEIGRKTCKLTRFRKGKQKDGGGNKDPDLPNEKRRGFSVRNGRGNVPVGKNSGLLKRGGGKSGGEGVYSGES